MELKSVVRSIAAWPWLVLRTKTFVAAVSALVVLATMFVVPQSASADMVQHQSYQRASQTEVCAPQIGETPWQADWGNDPSWKPSWEFWANKGVGGWVCSRTIVWAKSGSSGVSCILGDIGPGGGLIFLAANSVCYEMAPNTWSGGAYDPESQWCSTSGNVTTSEAIGAGRNNTTAMLVACSSGAAHLASAYRGGGLADWFLPSRDEMNAMCNYSRNPSTPLPSSVDCFGTYPGTIQSPGFATSAYGFTSQNSIPGYYWTSSQWPDPMFYVYACSRRLGGAANAAQSGKTYSMSIRPIRAYSL